jgi:hypothetical protein
MTALLQAGYQHRGKMLLGKQAKLYPPRYDQEESIESIAPSSAL